MKISKMQELLYSESAVSVDTRLRHSCEAVSVIFT